MSPRTQDMGRLAIGTALDPAFIIDLTLAADASLAWRLDFTTGSLFWNPGMDELLGVSGTRDGELGARLREAVDPMIPAARSATPGQDFELEQQLPDASGFPRWLRFRARTYDTGTSTGLFGIASDVTEQREARQALADIADRYRLLVDLTPEAIAVHQQGHVVYVNPAFLRFFGATSHSEVLGRAITDFVHPDSIPAMWQRIKALTTPGATSEPTEVELLRFDGSRLAIESVSVRTTWEGEPAFQVIMRDVTAQKAAEAALRYQAALVSHVSDAIIATDAESVVTSWNPAAETIYGHPAASAIGRLVPELLGSPLTIEDVVRTGGVLRSMHRRSDGSSLAVRVSAAPMDGGYVLVCADETPQRRAERRFATVVASLEEGVIVMTPEGAIESANPAALRILGTKISDLTGVPARPPLLALFDEDGRRIPRSEYPMTTTRMTGIPQNGRLLCIRRVDGTDAWVSLSCRPLNADSAPPHSVVASFSDTTERRRTAERLHYDATHDVLTGLANRAMVVHRLTDTLGRPHRAETIVVLFIDLDKFKVINDSLGHATGDEVLRVVGCRLRQSVRGADLVGRLGGDEFVVLGFGINDPADARALAMHLRSTLVDPIRVDNRELHIDASIGIVLAGPDDSRSADDLIRDADVAMYEAKTNGRGRNEFFDVALRERMQRRLRLEQDLRDAVRLNELVVAYQQVVALPSAKVVGVEALLRWHQPHLGVVSPVEFIPLAEESDLISAIGIQTLRATTHEMARQRQLHGFDLHVAVNLSARQLDNPDLLFTVQHALHTANLPAEALCLEITESALMRDPLLAAKKLDSLRSLGVRIAIDDFGTGYASLSQLLRLPVDILKIDQSFVADLGESSDAAGIVNGIVAMAHAVGLTVIAEGVETAQQLEILCDLGCDQAQGHYFGRPGTPDDIFSSQR